MTSPIAKVTPDFQLFTKDFTIDPKDTLKHKFNEKFRQFKEDEKKFEQIHLEIEESDNDLDDETFPVLPQSMTEDDLIDDLSSDEEAAPRHQTPPLSHLEVGMPSSLTQSYYSFSQIPHVTLAMPSPQKSVPGHIRADFLKV